MRQILDPLNIPEQKRLIKCLPDNVVDRFAKITGEVVLPPSGKQKKHMDAFGILVGDSVAKQFVSGATSEDDSISSDLSEAIQSMVGKLVSKYQVVSAVAEHPLVLESLDVTGHPDVWLTRSNGDCIPVEVKTSTYWKKMALPSLVQLMTYVMFGILAGHSITRAVLFLPLQKKAVVFHVRGWDFGQFLLLFSQHTQKRCAEYISEYEARFAPKVDMRCVGYHAGKEPTILATLQRIYETEEFSPDIPIQMFFASPSGGANIKITGKDADAARAYIAGNELRVYIHAPYWINLCDPCEGDGGKRAGALNRLVEELDWSAKLGMRAVVVHVGKAKTIPPEEAWATQLTSIAWVLDHSRPESVLLLETAAGQGTETATTPEEITRIYHQFAQSHPGRFAVCVDTCHVFAAGYQPDEFLKSMWDTGVVVKLIHLNGSMGELGCRKDRHRPVNYTDQQYIPHDRLNYVTRECRRRRIDMVIE